MEWMSFIGFIALILFCGFVAVSGIVANIRSLGFAGKIEPIGIVLFILGCFGLYLAWVYKPFEIVIN